MAPPVNGLVGSTATTPTVRRGSVVSDEPIDERGLAGAGRAGDADDVGAPGAREQRAERHRRPGLAVVEIAHEPRRGPDVAREDPVRDGVSGRHQYAAASGTKFATRIAAAIFRGAPMGCRFRSSWR